MSVKSNVKLLEKVFCSILLQILFTVFGLATGSTLLSSFLMRRNKKKPNYHKAGGFFQSWSENGLSPKESLRKLRIPCF